MRETHEFQYSARDIANAAKKRADYHLSKLNSIKDDFQNGINNFTFARWKELLDFFRRSITKQQSELFGTMYSADFDHLLILLGDYEKYEVLEMKYREAARIYGSQGEKVYLLKYDDVRYFGLAE